MICRSIYPGYATSEIARSKEESRLDGGGLIITAILLILFAYLEVPRLLRLIIFIPSAMSAIGFLQARMHFCAYFGIKGVFNFGELGETSAVEQAEFRAKDFKKALQIIVCSAIIGITAAVAAYYL